MTDASPSPTSNEFDISKETMGPTTSTPKTSEHEKPQPKTRSSPIIKRNFNFRENNLPDQQSVSPTCPLDGRDISSASSGGGAIIVLRIFRCPILPKFQVLVRSADAPIVLPIIAPFHQRKMRAVRFFTFFIILMFK